jgi:hypothetical protein
VVRALAASPLLQDRWHAHTARGCYAGMTTSGGTAAAWWTWWRTWRRWTPPRQSRWGWGSLAGGRDDRHTHSFIAPFFLSYHGHHSSHPRVRRCCCVGATCGVHLPACVHSGNAVQQQLCVSMVHRCTALHTLARQVAWKKPRRVVVVVFLCSPDDRRGAMIAHCRTNRMVYL